MRFSERLGIVPPAVALAPNAMPEALRNSLWNVLQLEVWDSPGFMWEYASKQGRIGPFAAQLWFSYFKLPIGDIPYDSSKIFKELRAYFFRAPWAEVYDFLEAVIAALPYIDLARPLNSILERELAAYRVVKKQFVPVTLPTEVEALEEALSDRGFPQVGAHLASALAKLSSRTDPDYRNSIKESISAVEAMANIVAGKQGATLEDVLKALEKNRRLHPALAIRIPVAVWLHRRCTRNPSCPDGRADTHRGRRQVVSPVLHFVHQLPEVEDLRLGGVPIPSSP